MNEITKIHIGRQQFTIAVDAYKALQDYLHAIKRQVGKNGEGVIEEVELRIVELLAERGVTGDTVVVPEDISYVKEQLGAPGDFKDDDVAEPKASDESAEPEPTRRLFRDVDHGMLAGVSSGIANYFGIDAFIVRLLFLIAAVAGGWGIPIYLILWLIVPEAKTTSDRLQMRGRAVTIDSIKEVVDRTVDRADVPGVAQRAGRTIADIIQTVFRIILLIAGAAFVTGAVAMLTALAMTGVYALLHGGHLLHGVVTFPVGVSEAVVAAAGFGLLAALASFLLAVGIAMARRKWSVPAWVTAALAGVFLVSLVAGGAAMPDTVQTVRTRTEAAFRTDTRDVTAFEHVKIQQGDTPVSVRYVYSDAYKVQLRYFGNAAVAPIKTAVQDKTLAINTHAFSPERNGQCDVLCIAPADLVEVVIYAPMDVGYVLE